ncbi:hypothetical protein SAMN02745134_00580 [Clostridium acidisoli DSM 12555]|uniref:Uncharacterized protein n=1 Tax=Clostridium acidisoli DSM 12555 TaxID=1121291 RepID=A0A1W1X3S8_9CLOT|nr:hypothetical protein [Clostridium acidisoli]SMC18480.1 hypothetical protein SAMN02745134_00580 [Clostridium acidisoli DSM 12555]
MAVKLYIANEFKEIKQKTKSIVFREEIQEYLIKTKNRTMPKSLFLLKLDPYRTHRVLEKDEVRELIEIAKLLKDKYEEIEINKFADELLKFCSYAIENDVNVFALGD